MCTHIRDHHHYARDNVILCALCAAAYVREIGLRRTPCRGHGHIVSHLESLSLVGTWSLLCPRPNQEAAQGVRNAGRRLRGEAGGEGSHITALSNECCSARSDVVVFNPDSLQVPWTQVRMIDFVGPLAASHVWKVHRQPSHNEFGVATLWVCPHDHGH